MDYDDSDDSYYYYCTSYNIIYNTLLGGQRIFMGILHAHLQKLIIH